MAYATINTDLPYENEINSIQTELRTIDKNLKQVETKERLNKQGIFVIGGNHNVRELYARKKTLEAKLAFLRKNPQESGQSVDRDLIERVLMRSE